MSEQVRSVTRFSAILPGSLTAERLSELVGVTLRTGSSDTGSTIYVVSTGACVVLSSVINSNNSRCAGCRPTKVGGNRSIALLEPGTVVSPVGKWLPCDQTKPEFMLSLRRDFWPQCGF